MKKRKHRRKAGKIVVKNSDVLPVAESERVYAGALETIPGLTDAETENNSAPEVAKIAAPVEEAIPGTELESVDFVEAARSETVASCAEEEAIIEMFAKDAAFAVAGESESHDGAVPAETSAAGHTGAFATSVDLAGDMPAEEPGKTVGIEPAPAVSAPAAAEPGTEPFSATSPDFHAIAQSDGLLAAAGQVRSSFVKSADIAENLYQLAQDFVRDDPHNAFALARESDQLLPNDHKKKWLALHMYAQGCLAEPAQYIASLSSGCPKTSGEATRFEYILGCRKRRNARWI